jgi:ubiquitin-like modifier-activating enzyme ATG7
MVVIHDPSASPHYPGWGLRNVLFYLHARHGISSIKVMCLRQGGGSRVARVCVSPTDPATNKSPQAVGWERDGTGKLASRVANLGPMLDPSR